MFQRYPAGSAELILARSAGIFRFESGAQRRIFCSFFAGAQRQVFFLMDFPARSAGEFFQRGPRFEGGLPPGVGEGGPSTLRSPFQDFLKGMKSK